MIRFANIFLWDHHMGSLAEDTSGRIVFEYTPDFVASGINPSPIFVTPEKDRKYEFSHLPRNTFKGLPGFIADSLPDKFGTAIIDSWLSRNGRTSGSYTVIERLLYQGSRSMGALRFEPRLNDSLDTQTAIELDGLIKAASQVLDERRSLNTNLDYDQEALLNVLRIGTSAGGARAKAVVAYDKSTGQLLSGQVDAPDGYEHFLLKLDGVYPEAPDQYGKTSHYGFVEHAYYRMALDCGIDMNESFVIHDGERNHFMTKRFDRNGNERIHMVSLCGMSHMDFNDAGSWSYEQLFATMRRLMLPAPQMEEAYRRMVFNVVAVNQDDHTKNFSFLLDREGEWRLSPAYDMTYANGSGYTSRHQMSVNNKRQNITRSDLLKVATEASIPARKANEIIDHTVNVVSNFEGYVDPSVPDIMIHEIKGAITNAQPS